MNFKTLALTVTVAASLAACSVSHTNQAMAPEKQSGGLFGLAEKSAVEVQEPKVFAGVNQVVVASFKVAFIDSKKDSAKAGSGFGGKSSANMKLLGLTPAMMQDVTDAAYADFLAKMKAQGIAIADRSALLASPEFSKVAKTSSPLREEASFFGSTSDVTYVAPTGMSEIYFFMGEAGKTGGFGFGNATVAASMFAEKNGLPVVSVLYTVDFANAGGSGGRFSATSSLQVGQGMTVAPQSGIVLVKGQGGTFNPGTGSVKLGQAVYSTETFGEVVNTTSDAAIATETALNVFSAVLGGGTNQSRSFEVKADPVKFTAVVKDVLARSNKALLDHAATLR